VCRGDQGFLNEYFSGFASSPVFDPKMSYGASQHDSMMLPTRYNADIGLYVFNSNRWLVEPPIKVIHYTLGSFKPWSWWCGWLIEEQARWNVRPITEQHLARMALHSVAEQPASGTIVLVIRAEGTVCTVRDQLSEVDSCQESAVRDRQLSEISRVMSAACRGCRLSLVCLAEVPDEAGAGQERPAPRGDQRPGLCSDMDAAAANRGDGNGTEGHAARLASLFGTHHVVGAFSLPSQPTRCDWHHWRLHMPCCQCISWNSRHPPICATLDPKLLSYLHSYCSNARGMPACTDTGLVIRYPPCTH
jgi:hypothetical protein